jgi:hypothetical protein
MMAQSNKDKLKSVDEVDTPMDSEGQPPTAARLRETRKVTVVMRRPAKCGEMDLGVGDPLGEVNLLPGVDLNYLVDAVRGGLAGSLKP